MGRGDAGPKDQPSLNVEWRHVPSSRFKWFGKKERAGVPKDHPPLLRFPARSEAPASRDYAIIAQAGSLHDPLSTELQARTRTHNFCPLVNPVSFIPTLDVLSYDFHNVESFGFVDVSTS